MSPGPPNGTTTHKAGMHPTGYPMPRVPLAHYHGAPPAQPYAIPTRGAVHGPVGAVPHVPQPGSRGFGAGRGSAGTAIGSHLPHQQASQQPVGSLGSNFNFPSLENPSSQPSVGPLSQPGYVSNVCTFFHMFIIFSQFYDIFLQLDDYKLSLFKWQMTVQGPSQTFRDGFSISGMSQVLVLGNRNVNCLIKFSN